MLQRGMRFFQVLAVPGAAAGEIHVSNQLFKTHPRLQVKCLCFPHNPCTGSGFQDRGDGKGSHLCSTLTHHRGSPAHGPTRSTIATLPGIVKAQAQQPASHTIPCSISFTRQKLSGKTACAASKCRWSRQHYWRWLPFWLLQLRHRRCSEDELIAISG